MPDIPQNIDSLFGSDWRAKLAATGGTDTLVANGFQLQKNVNLSVDAQTGATAGDGSVSYSVWRTADGGKDNALFDDSGNFKAYYKGNESFGWSDLIKGAAVVGLGMGLGALATSAIGAGTASVATAETATSGGFAGDATAAGYAGLDAESAATLGGGASIPFEGAATAVGATVPAAAAAAAGGGVLETVGAIGKVAASVAGIAGVLGAGSRAANAGSGGNSLFPVPVSTQPKTGYSAPVDGSPNFVGPPATSASDGAGGTTVVQVPGQGTDATMRWIEIGGFAIAVAGFIWQLRKGKKSA